MKITVAKNAGFCFGVKRATDSLEAAIEKKERGRTDIHARHADT